MPSDAPLQRTCVVVLGMHRSGTSMVAGLLSLSGVGMGTRLKGPSRNNAKGFFEHLGVKELNEKMMERIGAAWDDPRPLADGWEGRLSADGFEGEALDVLRRDFGGEEPLIGVKDPRMCRLMPFWKGVLAKAGFSVKFLVPFRNPLNVAASLMKRDGMARQRAVDIWKAYVGESLKHSEGQSRFFIDYDGFLPDKMRRVENIAAFLGLTPPSEEKVDAFVSPDLRHQDSFRREDISDADARRLHDALLALEKEQKGCAA